ncbi:hypothetical protein OG762_27725 [Streptomyces sp. NBC_01136]|uniref:LPXTG cell wall anchor domain-containing protein n=1 Tax=unclassified Streptomyces TaxID=2593676 RepID=UPI003256730E|nr:hypothetical protein OG762_27725 [Streptomyces sp. NBC_01136]
MTKKTRIRVARIAAGVVIAAGASLTAAGAASAYVGTTADDPSPTPTETGIPTSPEPTETTPSTPESTPPAPTETAPSETAPTTIAPTDEPTDPTEEPTEPTDPTDDPTGGSGTGTGNDSNPDGGSKPVEQGKGSSGLTDTGSDTSSGTSVQGKKGQLAETGAAETTFLLVGAATMIAGGVGFRLLPRLMGGRGAAA